MVGISPQAPGNGPHCTPSTAVAPPHWPGWTGLAWTDPGAVVSSTEPQHPEALLLSGSVGNKWSSVGAKGSGQMAELLVLELLLFLAFIISRTKWGMSCPGPFNWEGHRVFIC